MSGSHSGGAQLPGHPARQAGAALQAGPAVQADATLRRRQAVSVAGHLGDRPTARAGLADREPSVRGAAVRSLARLGDLSRDDLAKSLADPDAMVRTTALELAAARPEADVTALVTMLLDDPDPTVVEQAAWCCGERPEELRPLPRLVELAGSHEDPLVREAAVAALGALGDEQGRAAILAAAADKPAVRRRALIALAAFSGPDVDEALQRARTDPDRQVRDIVDDLGLPAEAVDSGAADPG